MYNWDIMDSCELICMIIRSDSIQTTLCIEQGNILCVV